MARAAVALPLSWGSILRSVMDELFFVSIPSTQAAKGMNKYSGRTLANSLCILALSRLPNLPLPTPQDGRNRMTGATSHSWSDGYLAVLWQLHLAT